MQNFFSVPDFQHLAFPGLLLAFYVISWLLAGRDPKIENVAPRYEPPGGLSPGVARYVLTGGTDGTTLAAVLTGLAAKGVISIQPQNGNYAVQLLNSSTIVLPDEASVLRTLFNTEQTVQPYADSNSAIVGNPDAQKPGSFAGENMTSPVTAQPRQVGPLLGWRLRPPLQPWRLLIRGPARSSRPTLTPCRTPSEKTCKEFISARTSSLPALAWLPP